MSGPGSKDNARSEDFKRAHPGFAHANYYRAVMWHEWRLMQAATERIP